MYGSATPGQLHAFGYTTAMWNGSAPPLDAASSFVELSFQWSDTLMFQSTSLAFGAPVSYTLEYVLDNTLNETATLCAGRPVGDAAPAPSIVLTGVGNTTELIQSPCGLPGSGSDHMVATVTFMSTVGGAPLIQEGVRLEFVSGGDWELDRSRQWETQRTLFRSAGTTVCPPAKFNGVSPANDEWLRVAL
jgi:hypothetical protein